MVAKCVLYWSVIVAHKIAMTNKIPTTFFLNAYYYIHFYLFLSYSLSYSSLFFSYSLSYCYLFLSYSYFLLSRPSSKSIGYYSEIINMMIRCIKSEIAWVKKVTILTSSLVNTSLNHIIIIPLLLFNNSTLPINYLRIKRVNTEKRVNIIIILFNFRHWRKHWGFVYRKIPTIIDLISYMK